MSKARRFTFAATALVWALAAGAAVAWGLRLVAPQVSAPAHARPAPAVTAVAPLVATDTSRLLGTDEVVATPDSMLAAPPSDPRYQLLGVVAPRSAPTAPPALALIAVDGKPPRAYRVGAVVAGDTVLRAVHARTADLGPRQGPVAMTLQLAPGSTSAAPVAVAPPAVPPRAPPPALPTVMPPGRTIPSFAPPPAGQPVPRAASQPRMPYGATPPGAAAADVPERVPVAAAEAPEPVQPGAEAAMAQNPATDTNRPVRRRNLPPDALR